MSHWVRKSLGAVFKRKVEQPLDVEGQPHFFFPEPKDKKALSQSGSISSPIQSREGCFPEAGGCERTVPRRKPLGGGRGRGGS